MIKSKNKTGVAEIIEVGHGLPEQSVQQAKHWDTRKLEHDAVWLRYKLI